MTSNMVMILAGILERLQYSFPESNSESEQTARVNDVLRPVRERLKQFIEKADANPDLANGLAKMYGTEIMRLAHSFEDSMDLYMLGFKSRKRNGFSNEIHNYRVYEKLLRDAGTKLNQACNFSIASLIHLAEEISSVSAGQLYSYESDMVGMVDAEEELVSALTEGTKHLRLVSICGMPGIGKTTLALNLYDNPEIEEMFLARAWISVSRVVNRREILLKIHYGVNSDADSDNDSQLSEDALAERVREYLKGKRYLVVLDDVPDADAWFCLRNCFPDNEMGSRILITTQLKDAAVGPETYIHAMRPLTDEETMDLLKSELKEEEIDKFGQNIKNASGGLPLAIVRLASSVKQNPTEKWEWHLENLYKGSLNSPLFNVLDKSYKNLPIHLRACLLYLGNYFTDLPDTETDTLCQLLIAEGLVLVEDKKNNIGETMMDVAAHYLDELDNRSFIQILEQEDGSDDVVSGERIIKFFKSCKIHNVIGGFCKSKENKHGFLEAIDLKDENQGSNLNLNLNLNLNSISSITGRIGIFLNENECSYNDDTINNNIRSLLIFNNSTPITPGYVRPREIPEFENFIRLRVLYLYALDLKNGKFPDEIENLVHLRYLSFRECYLEELCSSSVISNLFYLQTLDLRVRNEGQVVIIPDQNFFNCLERLRCLYLPPAYQVLPHGGKLRMEKVNELELLHNFDASQCYVRDLLKMQNLMWATVTTTAQQDILVEIKTILNFIMKNSKVLRSMSLNLEDYDCYSGERLDMLEKVFNSTSLHMLKVNGHIKELPIFGASGMTTRKSELTKIVLTGSELVDDPMKNLQVLPNLKILVLETEAYNGAGMKCSALGFPELRYLKLSKLYKLEDWQVEVEAMPKLCILILEGCKNLRMLPEGLRLLSSLRNLEIVSMTDKFVGRIIQKSDETEGEDFYKIRHVLPNVKVNGQILILNEKCQGQTQDGQQEAEDAKVVVNGQITAGDPHYGYWDQDYLS